MHRLQACDDELSLLQHELETLMLAKESVTEALQAVQAQCSDVEQCVSAIEPQLVDASMRAADLLMLTQQLQNDQNYVPVPPQRRPSFGLRSLRPSR